MNTKELEKRCNELFFQVNEKTERIAELEKENAELKKLFANCDTCKRTCDIGNCCKFGNAYLPDTEKVLNKREQLTKAKVFIRSLKSLVEDVCDINYLSKDNTRLLVEAEQFLKGVEK